MKNRNGFVTNSSSSSFIISKEKISREKLIEMLLEIANETYRWVWDDFEEYTMDDVSENCVANNYYIIEATKENPYQCQSFFEEEKTYTNHYIIDNDGNIRYNWCIVDEILEKYGLYLERGYCD